MTKLSNVTITKAANIYFDGNVTSRTIEFDDGSKQSLGIMMPGNYEFSTDAAELMEVLSGKVSVLLPGNAQWLNVEGGEAFKVPENSKFKIKVFELLLLKNYHLSLC